MALDLPDTDLIAQDLSNSEPTAEDLSDTNPTAQDLSDTEPTAQDLPDTYPNDSLPKEVQLVPINNIEITPSQPSATLTMDMLQTFMITSMETRP